MFIEKLIAGVFWLSPRGELVKGEETTPLDKLSLAVDSANGVGSAQDFQHFIYMNTDTVVHLHRLPVGVDFFDRSGYVGTCAQTLLVQRR
jgi:hypothetical protein